MSATDKTTADFGTGAVAHVNFRVRCEEGLGYGEVVFLVAKDETSGHEKVRCITSQGGSRRKFAYSTRGETRT